MHYSPAPHATINLNRCSECQSNPVIPKEGRLSTRVTTKIKIDVRTILIRSRLPILGTQWVALRGTEVVDHNDDASTRVRQLVARGVSLPCHPPAGTTCGSGAVAWACTVEVLTYCCAVSWVSVKAAGGGVGVAVGRPEAVAGAVMGY